MLYEIIKEAVEIRKRQGWTISGFGFVNWEKKVCCPIGALMLNRNNNDLDDLATSLKVKREDLMDIAVGFDVGEFLGTRNVYKELGFKLRELV